MEQDRALIEVLSEVTDFRKSRGKRHPLCAILAPACAAMLCGSRSYSAISEWGRNYGSRIARALGFRHEKTPCAATLCNVFRSVDRKEFESLLGRWAHGILLNHPGKEDEPEGIAIDGKTLRGSRKQGAPAVHLLSAVSHRLGMTLAQQAVEEKTNEIPACADLLEDLILKGRVVTADALLTQRKIAEQIIAEGGDYVMVVKENQPQLLRDIQLLFREQEEGKNTDTAEHTDSGHGRIEYRRLRTSIELRDYCNWPGLAQVFEVRRAVVIKKGGKERHETVCGVSSLPPEKADAADLLRILRGHWNIENRSHWVRDVTFDEDRSQVRCGSTPQVMAALRNTVIGLMRVAGEVNIAAACRRFAARPWTALALIGVAAEN